MKKKPSNEQYELAVIGTFLQYECNSAVEEFYLKCNPSFFFNRELHKFFVAIQEEYKKHGSCDIIMLIQNLSNNGHAFNPSEIAQLTDHAVSPASIEIYVQELHSLQKKRAVIETYELECIELYDNPSRDVNESIHQVSKKLEEIIVDGTSKIETFDTATMQVISQLKARLSGEEEKGEETYIPVLDKQLGKLQSGNMLVVSARPGQGKTALVCSICANWLKRGGVIHFFTFEMPFDELAKRILSNGMDVDYGSVQGKYGTSEKLVSDMFDFYSKTEGEIILDGAQYSEISAFQARVMEVKKKHGTQLIVVDYIQLMSSKEHKKNREQEVSNISRTLKLLAVKLQVPIIALAQLSRNVENRADKIPQLSDLRESGAIEQDADKVLFLMRPEYYGIDSLEDGSDSKGVAWGYIRKNRQGETGDVKMKFTGSKQRFENFIEEDPFQKNTEYENIRINREIKGDNEFDV